MKTIVSFHKEKNIICVSLYNSNKYPIFKRASTKNVSGTIL